MEYLFGFVFTLFKIAIQAGVYATAATWLVGLAVTRHPNRVSQRIGRDGWQVWQLSFVVAYAVLFGFSCTYWGDHSLGDSARLPLGHGEEIQEFNGTETFFEGKAPFMIAGMAGSQHIDSFQVTDELLCGQAEQKFYFVYNLATKENKIFASAQEYRAYAVPRGLPAVSDFQPFWKHYSRYWGGWRFWLLA